METYSKMLYPAEAGEFIAKHAQHVKIHDEGLDKLCQEVIILFPVLRSGCCGLELLIRCWNQALNNNKLYGKGKYLSYWEEAFAQQWDVCRLG